MMPDPSADLTAATPLVSIVTPAYNQAHFLAQTIESVLAQDYPRLEYIVLDDGSTDATPDVLARHVDRIICERHENMGQSRTLNKGWRMARGDIVGYLSSDDRLLPGAVSAGVRALLGNQGAVVSYCDYELIDATGRRIRTIRAEDYDPSRLRESLVCQPGPGALFWRSLLPRLGWWPEELEQMADLAFWLKASEHGHFVRVPEVLAQFRVHEASASYRPISEQRATEVIRTVRQLSAAWPERQAMRGVAMAHLCAARAHIRSGRIPAGGRELARAARLRPPILLEPLFWRHAAAGLLRRAWYSLRART
jgi:hypothetical protein